MEKQIYCLTTDAGSNVLKVGQLMKSDVVVPENLADQNEKDECDVTEAFDNELWESVVTTKDKIVITVKCAV